MAVNPTPTLTPTFSLTLTPSLLTVHWPQPQPLTPAPTPSNPNPTPTSNAAQCLNHKRSKKHLAAAKGLRLLLEAEDAEVAHKIDPSSNPNPTLKP